MKLILLSTNLVLQNTWCVAKPSSDEKTLLQNLNYACSNVDCNILKEGCPCFSPNNLMNHASIAMNLYYQSKGRNPWNCHFGNSALVVLTDPSKSLFCSEINFIITDSVNSTGTITFVNPN